MTKQKPTIVDPLAEDVAVALPVDDQPPRSEPSDTHAARSDSREQIKDLEHQLAALRTAELDKTEPVLAGPSGTGETLLIHILEDGLTAFGEVWYRGQELEFEVGSEGYAQTLDRNGNSWLDLDDQEQMARWGLVRFRRGPWAGKPWEEGAEQEQKRNRRVPVFRL